MSIRFYVRNNCPKDVNLGQFYDEPEGGFFQVSRAEPRTTQTPKSIKHYLKRVTWSTNREVESGYHYALGLYRGENWEAEIVMGMESTGYGKSIRYFNTYKIAGSFPNVETLRDFEHALTYDGLLPTIPLGRELTLTEQDYAKKASLAVANSVSIRELNARLDQAMNHIQSLQQVRQDQVAVPV